MRCAPLHSRRRPRLAAAPPLRCCVLLLLVLLGVWSGPAHAASDDQWYPDSQSVASTLKDEQAETQAAMQTRKAMLAEAEDPNQSLMIRAVRQEYLERENTVILSGFVQVWRGLNFFLTAEKVTYNHFTETMRAEGDVVVRFGEDRIVGDWLDLDLELMTATMGNARAFFAPSMYVHAEELRKLLPHPRTGKERFAFRNVRMSSCRPVGTQEWSTTATKGLAHIDHHLQLYHSAFWGWKIPVFYTPYMTYPIKSERSTGFLIPRVGRSNHAGWYLLNDFYWAINDYADATIGYDTSQLAGDAQSLEVRYNISERSKDNILKVDRLESSVPLERDTSFADDRNSEVYKVYFNHNHIFGDDWRANAHVDYSNQAFSSESFATSSGSGLSYIQQDFRSSATLTKAWGRKRLTIEARQDQSVAYGNELTYGGLPRATFRLSNQRFGRSQFYLDVTSVAEWATRRTREIYRDGVFTQEKGIGRVHLSPTLRYQYNELPWLTIVPRAGFYSTWYSDRKEPATAERPFGTWLHRAPTVTKTEFNDYHALAGIQEMGDGYRRDQYFLGTTLTGPVFQRVFAGGAKDLDAFQHQIIPELDYLFIPLVEPGDAPDIPRDFGSQTKVNRFRFSLTNRFTGKYVTGTDSAGKPRTQKHMFAQFRISQTYDLYLKQVEDKVRELGYGGVREFKPWGYTEVDFSVISRKESQASLFWHFDPLDGRSVRFQARGRLRTGNVEWDTFYTWSRSGTLYNLEKRDLSTVSMGLKWNISPSWELEATDTYNLRDELHQYAGLLLTYKRQCWAVTAAGIYQELRSFFVFDEYEQDTRIEFSLHLRNLGELGDAKLNRYTQ